MFHLAVVFMPVLLLGLGIAIIATLLAGLGLLIAAMVGSTSVALLVKDRRLMLLGCGVLALAGIACVGLVLSWPYLVAAGCCLGAVVLAIVGLCGCRCIGHKAGRIGATLLFAFAMASALLFGAIIVAIGMR